MPLYPKMLKLPSPPLPKNTYITSTYETASTLLTVPNMS